jgi:hypothetical protein
MEWLGTVGAAAIAALAAGVTLVVGARIKGEWWPGELRRAQRLNDLLKALEPDSPTAALLARERDESLQRWALQGRIARPESIVAVLPVLFLGTLLLFLGMGTIAVLLARSFFAGMIAGGESGIAVAAGSSFVLGGALILITIPVILLTPDYRWRAARALRRRFGLAPTIESEASRILERAREVHKLARRRARAVRRARRWARWRSGGLSGSSAGATSAQQ